MSIEPFIGAIMPVAFNFAPKGWALCNGQLLPINQNQALFSLLGTTYGGNGQTTFALPDLRGRVPVGASPGGWGEYSLGQQGGAESVALTSSQLAAHRHALPAAAERTTSRPEGKAPAPGGFYGAPGTTPMATTGSVGGGQPHYNMQPYLTLNYVIALQGIFPSRD